MSCSRKAARATSPRRSGISSCPVPAKKDDQMTFQTVDEAVSSWLHRYATATVPLGDLLCDAHKGIALEYDGPGGPVSMSYAELRERSMRLAGALRETGVADGAPIAVMLPKSPELLVALVAI